MTSKAPVVRMTSQELLKRRVPAAFKVCPLCDALNVKENEECGCCRWSGAFDSDTHRVQIKMWQMVDSDPELQMGLLRELRKPWWNQPLNWLKARFRRRIDYHA